MAIENLCLNVYFDNNVFGPYTFLYTGVMNNHSYWYSSMDDLTIQYNQDARYWEVLNIETIINAKLRNTTDSTDTVIGNSSFGDTSGNVSNNSEIVGRFTISAQKVFEIQHRVQTTGTTNGFGVENGFGEVEIYTNVRIWKVA